jgi:hypothetical protein
MIVKRTKNITFFLLLVIIIIFNFDVSLSGMSNEKRKDKKELILFRLCHVFVITALLNCLLRTLARFYSLAEKANDCVMKSFPLSLLSLSSLYHAIKSFVLMITPSFFWLLLLLYFLNRSSL